MAVDPTRLRKTLAFLLRHRPDVGRLTADAEGWFELQQVTRAVQRLLRSSIESLEVARVARSDPRCGFELDEDRIRARKGSPGRRRGRQRVPDILYLSATKTQLEEALELSSLPLSGRRSFRLQSREQEAWVAAHRRGGGRPAVLYVEAGRAIRAGVSIRRSGSGQYTATALPTRFVLNLRPGFDVQASAGGFLVRKARNGGIEVGLVRVRRRSGVTWEVAKGKSEIGETPARTAVRELQEEMGIDTDLEVIRDLGVSHYGFSTPKGEPRLKLLHLFVLRPLGPLGDFQPALPEGIEQVAFFDADGAVRVVTHGSLREPVRQLRRWIRSLEGTPELDRWPLTQVLRAARDEQPVGVDDAQSQSPVAGEE